MAAEVVMPRLGWTMEEGSVVEWLKRDGEAVRAGELLFSIESDKATNEVEALDSGVLRIPPDSPPPGTAVPIGTVLAYLVAPGEAAPFERAGDGPAAGGIGRAPDASSAPASADHGRNGHDAPTVAVDIRAVAAAAAAGAAGAVGVADAGRAASGEPPDISPRARRVAAELGVAWTALAGSGRTGRIVERDVRAAAEQAASAPVAAEAAAEVAPRAPRLSPLARRIAADTGLDVAALAEAKPGARLTRADVEGTAPAAAPATASDTHAPLPGIRRLIAARLTESHRTTAPVTLTTEADASRLVRLRQEMRADLTGDDRPLPSITDLLVRIAAVALTEHPDLNATLADGETVRHEAVHVGIAVDTERGLLVPVVRGAQARSVQSVAAESARLIAAARAGTVGPDDLRGSTFTITNLGMYEIDAFTPLINLPECAILGVGRIVARPVVIDEAAETVGVRRMLALSLTFDHRLVDGAPAARFLQRIKHLIERPTLWLTR